MVRTVRVDMQHPSQRLPVRPERAPSRGLPLLWLACLLSSSSFVSCRQESTVKELDVPFSDLLESASNSAPNEVFVSAELVPPQPELSEDSLSGPELPETADVVAYEPMEVTMSEPVETADADALPDVGPDGSLSWVSGIPAAIPTPLPPAPMMLRDVVPNHEESLHWIDRLENPPAEVEEVGFWWGNPDGIGVEKWMDLPGRGPGDGPRPYRIVNPKAAFPAITPWRLPPLTEAGPPEVGLPPLTEVSPPEVDQEETLHEVQRGETLIHIGRRHGREATAIAEENQLRNPDRIKAGQWLRIPGRGASDELGPYRTVERKSEPEPPAIPFKLTPANIEASPSALSGETLHEVQQGETLFMIGRLHGTPAEAIAEKNLLKNPDRIQAGQWLRIPSVSFPPSPEVRPDPVVAPLVLVNPVPPETPRERGWRIQPHRQEDRNVVDHQVWTDRVESVSLQRWVWPEKSLSADQPAPLVQPPVERSWAVYSSDQSESAANPEPEPPVRATVLTPSVRSSSTTRQERREVVLREIKREPTPIVVRADSGVTSRLRPVPAPFVFPTPEPVQVAESSTGAVAFCQVRYTVQPSDTVASIARAHGISENEVLGWSEEPAIYPGQVLLIPVRSWIAGTRSAE